MDGRSFDVLEENIKKMKQLFPEVFTEDKVDIKKLQQVLGEYTEDKDERYDFTWNGKRDAIRISQLTTTGTLRPDKESSKNWDETENLYIEGDNLEVLKLLQKSYHNKIKMIYIDPPYNTGNDFVYRDNYRDNIKSYLEYTGQADSKGRKRSTNVESSGRYHTDWLNMMYPRLRLARNLLTDDGLILISIDYNEIHNLKKICDEIFGEDNFIEIFSWQKTSTPPNLSYKTKKSLEYILAYEKNTSGDLRGLVKYSSSTNGLMNQSNSVKKLIFPKEHTKTSMKNEELKKGKYGTASYDIYLLNDIKVKDGRFSQDIILEGKFKWNQEYLDEQIRSGTEIFIKTKVLSPSYDKEEYDAEKPWNLIDKSFGVGTNVNASDELDLLFFKNFSERLYPKPISLLKYLINMLELEDSVVLDFFAGSSTTAHAVMDLNAEDNGNRKFIMVQLPEETDEKSEAFKAGYKTISEIGRERIRLAGEKIKEDNKDKEGIENLDIGFKSFKLDSSNIKEWNPQYEDKEFNFDSLINNFLEDRGEEDILYEIILKYGIDLTTPIEEHDINRKTIYDIGFGTLYICLDDDIDENVVEKIVDLNKESNMERARVVFKDIGFKDDETKLNAKLTLENNGIEEVLSI